MPKLSQDRLDALKELLLDAELSTQDELREKLERRGFVVTQSTVSRDLRKLGAVKALDVDGDVVYRLEEEAETPVASGITNLVRDIETNGQLIVIHTTVGSASLVARHLDRVRPGHILGTIAGDDTIFVAPAVVSPKEIKETIRAIEDSVESLA